jgi:uncharacterized protein YbjT (DUF2867 family)
MSAHKVFVAAATGTVGGAVARQLRALGWEVRTTTRNTESPAAQALASIGVQVHRGSWSDTDALEAALAGCDLLFLNLMPDLADMTSELTFGKTIVRIAKAAGVKHAIYSSVITPSEIMKSPLMQAALQAKFGVADEVRAAFQYSTILQPGSFMANFLAPKVDMLYPGATDNGLFVFAFHPDTKLPMVDQEDIAAYVVTVFQNPEKFHGKELRVVSEMVTVEEAIETLRRATGRNIRAKYLTDEELNEAKASNMMLALQEVQRDSAEFGALHEVVAEAKNLGLAPGTFSRFVEREKKDLDETYQKVRAN